MPTIAEMVRKQPDPYAAAIEVFSRRDPDRLNRKITFWFADDSSLSFQITYTPIDEETNDENV